MAGRPDKRIVLKSKEPNEHDEYDFVPLLAMWKRDAGEMGYRIVLDGRIKGISIKWEDQDGEIRTTHVRNEECEWWFNEYTTKKASEKPAKKAAKKAAKKVAKKASAKRREEPEAEPDDTGDDAGDDTGDDDIPF